MQLLADDNLMHSDFVVALSGFVPFPCDATSMFLRCRPGSEGEGAGWSRFPFAVGLSGDLGINPFSADHEIGGRDRRAKRGDGGGYPPCCCCAM